MQSENGCGEPSRIASERLSHDVTGDGSERFFLSLVMIEQHAGQ